VLGFLVAGMLTAGVPAPGSRRTSRGFQQEVGYRAFHPQGPHVNNAGGLVPELTWSPTELGEKVLIRFCDAGANLTGTWISGSAEDPG
jgi:hypothetical protein